MNQEFEKFKLKYPKHSDWVYKEDPLAGAYRISDHKEAPEYSVEFSSFASKFLVKETNMTKFIQIPHYIGMERVESYLKQLKDTQ